MSRASPPPDNLVFDKAGNLWVVTDISSSTLNVPPAGLYTFHGQQRRVHGSPDRPERGRRRSASPTCRPRPRAPGPYFTPDEQTLFVNVQNPGEETPKKNKGGKREDPAYVHLVLAEGQQDRRPEPVRADPVTRGDHQAPTKDVTPPPGANVDPDPARSAGRTGRRSRRRRPAALSLLSPARQSLVRAPRERPTGVQAQGRRAGHADADPLRPAVDASRTAREGEAPRARHPARHDARRGHDPPAPGGDAARAAAPRERRALLRWRCSRSTPSGNRTTRTKRLSFRR